MSNRKTMTGKTVVVTGATAGIGLATAKGLAGRGAAVIGVSRSPEKCARIEQEIRQMTGNDQVRFVSADLSSLSEVRVVADEILSSTPGIDVLINNAAAIFLRRQISVDGFEKTLALNFLSPFLLTNLLLDSLLESTPARIINVASRAHFRGDLHFGDIHISRNYRWMKAYSQSKLALMLFTYDLARKLQDRGVTVNAMDPGLVRTDIATNNGFLVKFFQRIFLRNKRSPAKGAETILYLATDPQVREVRGKYFLDKKTIPSAERSYDLDLAARVWHKTEELTASQYDL